MEPRGSCVRGSTPSGVTGFGTPPVTLGAACVGAVPPGLTGLGAAGTVPLRLGAALGATTVPVILGAACTPGVTALGAAGAAACCANAGALMQVIANANSGIFLRLPVNSPEGE